MSTDLKCCPFCGSEAWGTFGPDENGYIYIECLGKNQDCLSCGCFYVTNDITDREVAVEQWNRRDGVLAEFNEVKAEDIEKLPPGTKIYVLKG